MAGTVLAVSTRALLDTCEELGLDAEHIAQGAGIDRRALARDPDARLAAATVERVWQAAFAASGDPGLALRAAEAVPEGAYRVLDYAAAASANLGDALRRVASYFDIVGRAVLSVDGGSEGATLRLAHPTPGRSLWAGAETFTLAAILVRTRRACGVAWIPTEVTFTFAAPADDTAHVRLFGRRPAFGAPAATLGVSAADLATPCVRADAGLAAILDEHAREVVARLPTGGEVTARVVAVLPAAIEANVPSVEGVAKKLGTTARTLQRRLGEEGTSFARLLDAERERGARAHLARRDGAIAEIAWLLGFSDQSAFTRAFRRWTGMTPAQYRSALRGRP